MKYIFTFMLFFFCLLHIQAEIAITGTRAPSPGLCNGTISGIANGTSGPYTVVLNGVQKATKSNVNGTFTFLGLCLGDFTVTVSNQHGCVWSFPVSIKNCDELSIEKDAEDLLDCEGANQAFINIRPTKGAAPYKFYWNDGITSEDRFNIGKGTYTVTVTDFNGCTGTTLFIVEEEVININPNYSLMSGNTGNCNGIIDLSVSVNPAVGGTNTFLWSNGQSTARITNLCTGAYTVTVTSPTGCTKTKTFNILNCSGSSTPVITGFDLSNASNCSQSGGGSVTVNTSGGISPFSYQWTNTSGSYQYSSDKPVARGITTGDTYRVSVSDGCFGVASDQVYVPCTCNLGAMEVGLEAIEPCFVLGRSAIRFNGRFCWSPVAANIHTPFNLKIIWPDNTTTVLSVSRFSPCGVSQNSIVTVVSGPLSFSVPRTGTYNVTVEDDFGCRKNYCFGFASTSRIIGFNEDALFNVLPSQVGIDPSFLNMYVATGCYNCATCSAGCLAQSGSNLCLPGMQSSDFIYQPPSPNPVTTMRPCQGGKIICPAGMTIDIPDYITGISFVDWTRPQQIPGGAANCCMYNVGCMYPSGSIFGINQNLFVNTTQQICDPDPAASICPRPPVSCPTIFRVYQPQRPCYYDEYCSDNPNTPIVRDQYDADETLICYQDPSFSILGGPCEPLYKLVLRCLLAPRNPVMSIIDPNYCATNSPYRPCDAQRGIVSEQYLYSGKLSSKVYPNPFHDRVYIKVYSEVNNEKVQIRFSNMNGQSLGVLNGKVSENEQTYSIPFDAYPSGIYMIEIIREGNIREVHKVVKVE